jgi:glycosyltransferase involved in cell wall biosynthesis
LKVGIDASVIFSSAGGTRTYATQLVGSLLEVREGWTFLLYARSEEQARELRSRWPAASVRVVVVPGSPNVWRVQARLPARLGEDGVDVYHSLGYFLPLRWPGPKVVTIHDLNMYLNWRAWLRSRRLLNWADMAVETPFAARAADRIITDSEFSKESICRVLRVDPSRVAAIHLAPDEYFDAAPAPEEAEEARALAGGRRYVLYVGVLSPQKNLGTLIRAFAESGLVDAGVSLVLAGPDRSRHSGELRAVADSARVGSSLVLPGFVSRGVLRALYHEALVVVLPSHGEGFGLPLVEAMAAGAPVFAANRQSLPEVVGEAGCLFEPDDVNGLAALVRRAGTDGTFRAQLVARSHARRHDFSWPAAAEATAHVYEAVLHKNLAWR